MAKYRITTDQGTYVVTTQDPTLSAQDVQRMSGSDLSPQSLLQMVPELANKAAGKAGEFVAEEFGRKGINPGVAAGAGTMVSMVPEVAMSLVPTGTATRATSPATGFARIALGFQKSFLKTPYARAEANRATKTALEEGVIPYSGNPTVMAERAGKLAKRTGAKLGELRESVGLAPTDDVLNSLEQLRKKLTKGRSGGIWDGINKRVDNAIDSVKALPSEASLNEVAEVKKRIGDSVNWLSDLATQSDTKKIVSAIERGVEKIFTSKGGDIKQLKSLKNTYGAAKHMSKGLQNEIAGQEGNMLTSLPSNLAAAGALASGNPSQALQALGLWELAKRRGSGFTARSLNDFANQSVGVKKTASFILDQMAKKRNKKR